MIDMYREILGLASEATEYDIYLVVICAITVSWVAKSVVSAVYNAVLHIFR